MKTRIKKIKRVLNRIEMQTDIIPFVLRKVVIGGFSEEESEKSDIHYGILSMAATVVWLAMARVVLSAVILFVL